MGKIIGKKELQKLAENADDNMFFDTFENLLSSNALKAAFRAALEGAYEDEETERVLEEASVDIAKRIENPMALYPIGICIPKGIFREAFAKGITKAFTKELAGLNITKDIIANVASLSCDEEFLKDCYTHPEKYGIEGSQDIVVDGHQLIYIDNLEIYGEYQKVERAKALGEDKTPEEKWKEAGTDFVRIPYIPPIVREEDGKELGPLDFTALEKYSIKLYEGAAPHTENNGGGDLTFMPRAYMTINTMFFDGVDNELERIFEDGRDLIPAALNEADEILDRSLDLFSAMYKYGKRMSEDKFGYRVDRASSAKQVYQAGHTISNFSTSMIGYSDAFSKKNIALIEATIRRGTPCADFKEILGYDEYALAGEREILVAPYARVSSKKPRKPETNNEKMIFDFDGNVAQAVYEMTVTAPESAKELTPMEEADLERKLEIFNDKSRREKAAIFIKKLHNLRDRYMHYTSEDALECIDSKDLEEYLEWKQAFQDVYRYKTRQIMLEIDKKIVENQKAGKPLFIHSMDERSQTKIEQDLEAEYSQSEIEDVKELSNQSTPAKEVLEVVPTDEGYVISKEDFDATGLSEEDLSVYGIVVSQDKPQMSMSSVENMVEKRNPENVIATGNQILDSLGKMIEEDKDPKKDSNIR